MTVREAVWEDLPGVLALYAQLHNSGTPEMNEDLLALWREMLESGRQRVIVAEEDGRVASTCMLVIALNLTHERRPFALIENVVTDARYRGRGLASACLEYAAETARAQNCYKVMLMTGRKEESTLNFYRRSGFNSEDKTGFIRWL